MAGCFCLSKYGLWIWFIGYLNVRGGEVLTLQSRNMKVGGWNLGFDLPVQSLHVLSVHVSPATLVSFHSPKTYLLGELIGLLGLNWP